MFASELIKSSSICLGAFRLGRLIGYLVVSRYADDWHIMNLAVDPAWRRRGVARQLLEDFLARSVGGRERGYTLEVRTSNDDGDTALRAPRFRGSRHPARLLPG